MEKRRGRRSKTSPGQERSNETGKLVITDGSVEFCEATPIGLVDEPKKFLYGRDTDLDLGTGMPSDFFFCSLFPVQQTTNGIGHRQVVFVGLTTNTLNGRNNNNNNNLVLPPLLPCDSLDDLGRQLLN